MSVPAPLFAEPRDDVASLYKTTCLYASVSPVTVSTSGEP